MVKNGHPESVRDLRYVADGAAALGLEILSFAELRGLPAGNRQPVWQRGDFHVLVLPTGGDGSLEVDFVTYRLEEDAVVWIRPGQVHRYVEIRQLEGDLVLFPPAFIASDAYGTARAAGVDSDLIRQACAHLRSEWQAGQPSPQILRRLLEVLLWRVAPEDNQGAPPGEDLLSRFAAAVEVHFTHSRDVTFYARLLVCSPRTLTRLTRSGRGVGAKRFIDDRVVLEAKRLLAFHHLTAAACASRLGFDDAANFAAFFRARTGTSPAAFARSATEWRQVSPTRD